MPCYLHLRHLDSFHSLQSGDLTLPPQPPFRHKVVLILGIPLGDLITATHINSSKLIAPQPPSIGRLIGHRAPLPSCSGSSTSSFISSGGLAPPSHPFPLNPLSIPPPPALPSPSPLLLTVSLLLPPPAYPLVAPPSPLPRRPSGENRPQEYCADPSSFSIIRFVTYLPSRSF